MKGRSRHDSRGRAVPRRCGGFASCSATRQPHSMVSTTPTARSANCGSGRPASAIIGDPGADASDVLDARRVVSMAAQVQHRRGQVRGREAVDDRVGRRGSPPTPRLGPDRVHPQAAEQLDPDDRRLGPTRPSTRVAAFDRHAAPVIDLYPVGRNLILGITVHAFFGERLAARADEIGALYERPQTLHRGAGDQAAPPPVPVHRSFARASRPTRDRRDHRRRDRRTSRATRPATRSTSSKRSCSTTRCPTPRSAIR